MARGSDRVSFGTYITPETHKALKLRAVEDGIPVRELVEKALVSLLDCNDPNQRGTPSKPISRMTDMQRIEYAADALAWINSNGRLRVNLHHRLSEEAYASIGEDAHPTCRIRSIDVLADEVYSDAKPNVVIAVQFDTSRIVEADKKAIRKSYRTKGNSSE